MSSVGQTIGRYRILEKLGEGGMGVVFRAEDSVLGRTVAIKVLRAEVSHNPDRVRRFSQEARAASALNHPNIVTVHDAGEFAGGPFLVMELVDGDSLRAHVRGGALPLPKVLDIGIQTAAALARAHESGITHRDLKPENVLVRRDGYVKVLDFGLAKLTEKDPASNPSGATTIDAGLTSEGAIVGTAAYMSPEQGLARAVDARSDIFSLALVLYECWQGHHPFLRASMLDTLHAVVHDPLPPFSYPPGSLEWGFARILEKALEKDPDQRYQTMKDLAVDLRRLKHESDSGKLAPGVTAAIPAPRRRPFLLYAVAGALLALLVAGSLALWRGREQPAAPPRVEYARLTSFTDSATSPAVSPDGRMLTFIRGASTFAGSGQIYVKLLPHGDPVQLTRDDRGKMSPVFSPDGSRIAYTAIPGRWSWDTWVVPVLGGEPRPMLANASGLTWIQTQPGESRILFSEIKRGIHMAIVTSGESRAGARDVYDPPGESGMAHRSCLSPDRKWILLAEMEMSGWLPCRVVPFDAGSRGRRIGPASAQCTDGAWSADGKWVYLSVNLGAGFHIWRQRVANGAPAGEPQQVTFGATEEEGIALEPGGRSLISSVGASQSSIWLHDAAGERQISSQGYGFFPSFSADGKTLYYLQRAGPSRLFVSGELWSADIKSGSQSRLLPDFLVTHYEVSRDSRRVVFAAPDAGAGGLAHVWLAALDGRSPPRQLSSLPSLEGFFGANDDIFLLAVEGGSRFIYRIKDDGGGLQKVSPLPVIFVYSASPDGKWIAAWVGAAEGGISNAAMAIPVSGGAPVLICNGCATAGGPFRGVRGPLVAWSPDSRFLYLKDQVSNMAPGKTLAFRLPPGRSLPPLPASGIKIDADLSRLRDAVLISQSEIFPGSNPSTYAFARVTTQRNLYRIPLPQD